MSGKIVVIAICLATLSLLACNTQPPVDLEAARASLLAADSAFAQASVDKNAAEAFKMFMVEDAIQMPAGGQPVTGREAIYEMMLDGIETYTLTWEPQDGDVASSGDMGWTWGLAEFTVQSEDGQTRKAYSKYLNVWVKDAEGNWKVKVDIGNQAPAPEVNAAE